MWKLVVNVFVYSQLDSTDNLQWWPELQKPLFYVDFIAGWVSRNPFDRFWIGSIGFSIRRFSTTSPDRWTHITSVDRRVMIWTWVSRSSKILYEIDGDLMTIGNFILQTLKYDNYDWKWIFHVVIVHPLQAWRKLTNFDVIPIVLDQWSCGHLLSRLWKGDCSRHHPV